MTLHLINGIKIRTDFVHQPIPIRSMDWQAVYDDDEPDDDGCMPCGHGPTEQAAIVDLIENHPRETGSLSARASRLRAEIASAERAADAEPIDTTIRAIRALGSLLHSEDSYCEDLAIEAAQAGRAAYWTSATYHNHAAVRFAHLANLGVPLAHAVLQCRMHGNAAASPTALIGSLIPLNPKARDALTVACKPDAETFGCVDVHAPF